MKKIIGGLLEYARAPRPSEPIAPTAGGVPGTSDPATVVRHVGALVAPQLKKAGAKLVTDVDAPSPIAIEAHALQQVLVNLVQNAAQAMASGGTITVTARPAPGKVATVISVADDGPGIPPADRTKVFDPFFTTKAPGKGSGLGLSVVHQIIEMHGGAADLSNRPGGGARFTIRLSTKAQDNHAKEDPGRR